MIGSVEIPRILNHLSPGLEIPRITIKVTNSLKTSEQVSVRIVHWDCPKKPTPQMMFGQPFENLSKSATNLISVLESDMR